MRSSKCTPSLSSGIAHDDITRQSAKLAYPQPRCASSSAQKVYSENTINLLNRCGCHLHEIEVFYPLFHEKLYNVNYLIYNSLLFIKIVSLTYCTRGWSAELSRLPKLTRVGRDINCGVGPMLSTDLLTLAALAGTQVTRNQT
jgi:hypothetical protein